MHAAPLIRRQTLSFPEPQPRRRQALRSLVLTASICALLIACAQPAPLPQTEAPATTLVEHTALDEYVATPDPAFEYELVDTLEGDGYLAFVLRMVSQRWLDPERVDRPLWEHWLTIVRPEDAQRDTALLYIGGGSNRDPAPSEANPILVDAALRVGAVTAELRMVPNQPLRFADDAYGERVEDELIAYAWDKFLRGGDPIWLPRLPMTKAAVRAMDTIAEFAHGVEAGELDIRRFVVAGGSKRGWTTWTTAAVDERVVAIVPIVIDLLNIEPSFEHHYRVYGFWAPAIGDYVREGIPAWFSTPEYDRLQAIVEPYTYRDRLDMPKLLINATGDQFFVPDSWKFYYRDLIGESHLRYVPNADHSLGGTDAAQSLVAFFQSVVDGTPRPSFEWEITDTHEIVVHTEPQNPPLEVRLWQATNPEARDFRVETIGRSWSATDLAGADGVYRGSVPAPASGWTAFLVELTYPGPGEYPFKLTTGVEVVPDTLPFPAPPVATPER